MNWNHLTTIIWLRWRLSKNQWARGGALNAVIGALVLAIAVMAAVAGGIGGFAVGWMALSNAAPQVLLLVWDGIFLAFLFFWMIGLVTEIQRSESIDISRLLHLPVSLKQIFAVNFLASHVTLSVVLVLPAMLGLSAGLAVSHGWRFMLLIPLLAGSLFMITAWTYCLRGWLVSLMVNQRRKRAIIMGVTVGFILLAQLPNLYFNVIRPRGNDSAVATEPASEQSAESARTGPAEMPPAFVAAHKYAPPLWLGNGAMSLAQGRISPALLGMLGAFAIGAAGLFRAYRSTIRFYRGEEKGKSAPRSSAPAAVRQPAANWIERTLPGVPEEAAPLALASFRSMLRAPEVKMMLVTPLIMLVIFGAMLFGRPSFHALPDMAKPFMATGAVAFALFGLVQLMFNQFGFDRNGFRALVLLPTARRSLLLGKNLSVLPLVMLVGLPFLLAVQIVANIGAAAILAGLFQLIAAFLFLSIVGNFVSVIAPYRIAAGSLKPTKTPAKTTLLIFVTHLLMPVALLPLAAPPLAALLANFLGWPSWLPVNLLLSILLAIAGAFLYHWSLEGLGAMLQRREKAILQTVTHEVE